MVVFRTAIYSLIHFLDEKFSHVCNGVKSCLNMCIFYKKLNVYTLTANIYRLIFVLCTQITTKKYFHHIVLYSSFFLYVLGLQTGKLVSMRKNLRLVIISVNMQKEKLVKQSIYFRQQKNWGKTIHEVAFPSFLDFKRYFSIMNYLTTW